jgi:hypothetical protein
MKISSSRLSLCALTLLTAALLGACTSDKADPSKPLKKARLLLELTEHCNTPDGMTLMANGDVILSAPNFNDDTLPAVLMKITPENKAELFYKLPPHPQTGKIGPLGVCAAPSGDLYLADCQFFADKNNKSRLLRIVMKDG